MAGSIKTEAVEELDIGAGELSGENCETSMRPELNTKGIDNITDNEITIAKAFFLSILQSLTKYLCHLIF